MSDTSGPGFSEPFAFYDPDLSSLRTCQGTLFSDSTESSPTLPKQGWMQDGWLYELPTLAHPTGENDCSLLPTPLAASVRKSRKALTARQWASPGLEQWIEMLNGELPREFNSWDEVNGASRALLPTPTASQPGGTAEQMLAREARMAGGPRATVTDLRMVVELLPSPTASDAKGSRRATARTEAWTSQPGTTLTDVAWLLPTPTARDWKGRNQRDDATCLAGALLPTPTAAVGAAGPDFARRTRPGSGGDDLQTTMVRLTGSDSGLPSDDGSVTWEEVPLPLW